MINHSLFIQSIHEKRVLSIEIESSSKGRITRLCAPLDFGPMRRSGKEYPGDKYFVFDLDSPDSPHPLHISLDKIISITATDRHFNPNTLVNWSPDWNIPRSW